jgi:hypothetical protein
LGRLFRNCRALTVSLHCVSLWCADEGERRAGERLLTTPLPELLSAARALGRDPKRVEEAREMLEVVRYRGRLGWAGSDGDLRREALAELMALYEKTDRLEAALQVGEELREAGAVEDAPLVARLERIERDRDGVAWERGVMEQMVQEILPDLSAEAFRARPEVVLEERRAPTVPPEEATAAWLLGPLGQGLGSRALWEALNPWTSPLVQGGDPKLQQLFSDISPALDIASRAFATGRAPPCEVRLHGPTIPRGDHDKQPSLTVRVLGSLQAEGVLRAGIDCMAHFLKQREQELRTLCERPTLNRQGRPPADHGEPVDYTNFAALSQATILALCDRNWGQDSGTCPCQDGVGLYYLGVMYEALGKLDHAHDAQLAALAVMTEACLPPTHTELAAVGRALQRVERKQRCVPVERS